MFDLIRPLLSVVPSRGPQLASTLRMPSFRILPGQLESYMGHLNAGNHLH